LPLNTKLVRSKPRGAQEGEQWYLVAKTPVITGREMRNARPGQGEFRKWETNFSLSQDGGKRFGRYTEANIGNKLAVVLDNQIVSVATISPRSRIPAASPAWAAKKKRRSVALPAFRFAAGGRGQYNEERSIGPSLGADSIHEGLVAGIAGLLAVITVMLVYYKRSGVNAVLALGSIRSS
jgi:preprotein translocase subunit SecD